MLTSGIGLLVTAALIGKSKPLWLKLMEDAGGMVALLFVVLVTWLTKSMSKALKEENGTRIAQIMKRFTIAALSFMVAIAGIILIVSMRFT
ncbi:hypothetical protein JNUCC42_15635 [Brevibacterium sp. JNUCC-42]|nr:hypothetical protein JNUCC42_15635 [Brevibacterium sp. JNUCC-42]